MIAASKMIIAILLISVVLSSVTTALAQSQWTRYGSSPVLTAQSWAPGGLYRPRVLYDGKIFKMWFGGLNQTGYSDGIGYANSTDGIKWITYPHPVLTAETSPENWAEYGGHNTITGLSMGSVVWTGSQYMMWYRGYNNNSAALGLATSPDGITWKKYSGNPVLVATTVDSNLVGSSYVIRSGSLYKMWYTCFNSSLPGDSICYASSSDGITWSKFSSPVLEPRESLGWEAGFLFSPAVIYDGKTYGMWYSGCNSQASNCISQLGYATSTDGMTWMRDPSNPILSPGTSGVWDAGGVENACVVQYNGGFLLYYDGYPTPTATTGYYIGLAKSPSNFVLPEIASPPLTVCLLALVLLTGLSFRKARQLSAIT